LYRSLDAALDRADSWEQVKKAVKILTPPDFWTATQKGIQVYVKNPNKREIQEPTLS
jgi:hypothetical protein